LDLDFEGIFREEFLLGAQKPVESDLHHLAINLSLEI
jgi:hypothetical protein